MVFTFFCFPSVFSVQLVLGISSEVLEDNFNVNWLEQKVSQSLAATRNEGDGEIGEKAMRINSFVGRDRAFTACLLAAPSFVRVPVLQDQTLGIPQMQFATREEDEFGAVAGLAAAGASSPIPGAAASGGVGSLEALVATHALLSPQHHRLGMSAADIAMAQAQEAAAKQALTQQQQQQQQQFVLEGQADLSAAASATEADGAAPNQGGGQPQQADGGAPMDSSE